MMPLALAKVVKKQRNAVRLAWVSEVSWRERVEVTRALEKARSINVTLTRVGAKLLDEPDNLNAACKHARDEVAAILMVDDGPKSIARWKCKQEIGTPCLHVRIEVKS